MQIKIKDALNAFAAAKQLGDRLIPHGPGMAIKRMLRELAAIEEDYREEQVKLLTQYASLNERGKIKYDENNRAIFENGQFDLFQEAHKELMDTLVEVNSTLELRGLEKVEIEPNILWLLGDLLIDPDEGA